MSAGGRAVRWGLALWWTCALWCGLGAGDTGREALVEGFVEPPVECRPHTRWWWMGNALTKDEISWQLGEMRAQGIGGVEQITMDPVYERGNVEYLSDEYFALLRHAVDEARRLGLRVSLNFGGPGWIWGGPWVKEEHRNQTLLSSSMVVEGPTAVDRALPREATVNPRDRGRSWPTIGEEDRLIAVVAGRETAGAIEPDSVRVLTDRVREGRIAWDAPEGTWRIMAFWATFPDDSAVNHIDKAAMSAYVEYIGERYTAALGDEYGRTIDSFFGDSFEVPIHRNGIYWSDALLEEFRRRKGYDLVTHLPALWWEVGAITGRVRYDVNEVLHRMGMEAFYETFGRWCEAHGVKSRVQPYGFVTDVLEGAGATDIPEMEITAGEKDAVPWFDTRIGPREYVASGAHIYGKRIVSTEAYTYLHWEPYRATLEELKIASDVFLRSGANLFYNHGFLASPERDIAPTRGFHAAIHISPDNVWWPHYRHLSDYVARCCYLLRQGQPRVEVAVYSPLANQWALDALNSRRWTRDFDWGELGRLLISNGYDFDLVNDDALQRLSRWDGQALTVGAMTYRAIVLPNIASMPVESLEKIEAYVAQGGVAIALERTPDASCGMMGYPGDDARVQAIASRLFAAPKGREPVARREVGEGVAYVATGVLDRSDPLDRHASARDPFLKTLRRHVAPDLGIDFVREDLRENDGLSFAHRADESRDVYFVTNTQDRAVDMRCEFQVRDAAPWMWDPYTGRVEALLEYREEERGISLPVRLGPYESTFVVFEKGEERPHVRSSSLQWMERVDEGGATGWTDRSGEHWADAGGRALRGTAEAVPAPIRVGGPWLVALEAAWFPRVEKEMVELGSWTDDPETRYFSGMGVYTTEFRVPEEYVREDTRLFLDLGDVGNVAEVWLNGEPAGVVWTRGRSLDVTERVRAGENALEVRVTNTLINRVAGMEEFPPVPEELRERLGRGVQDGRHPAHGLMGFEPLPRSGLLGPVEVRAYRRVEVK